MNKRPTAPFTALMAAIPLPADVTSAPDWIHLLPAPADGLVRTADSRGPYRLGEAAGVIAASFAQADRLEIDVNHATFLAAPRGERADAMGWIVEMQAREDGIWGRVEWNAEGAALVTGRAYRGLSPVIIHDAAKNILRIANASLVNRPNLIGLTSLNFEQEPTMNLMQRLAELLGLEAGATEEQILAAVEVNRPGFTGGQNSRRIARYGTDLKEEDLEAVFT
ncbi:phage protease [Paracoccaceae bacterium Fryx2]|nr:phage protease [Paracoccaceae bacterium Fryx2]